MNEESMLITIILITLAIIGMIFLILLFTNSIEFTINDKPYIINSTSTICNTWSNNTKICNEYNGVIYR